MKGRTPAPKITPDAARGLTDSRPGLYILEIMHDDWCETLRTGDGSRCNCEPDQRLVSYDDLKRAGRVR